MVQLLTNKNSYRIIMDKNMDVKIRDVYNSIFFSSLGLDGIRIYGKDPTPDIEDDVVDLSDTEDEDEDEETLIQTFGNEQPTSGYSKLPLSHESDSESESDSDNDDTYNFLGDYLTKYLNGNDKTKPNANSFEIHLPFDINNPVLILQNVNFLNGTNPLLILSQNGMTYINLNKIVQDIYQQIVYLSDLGFFYTSIDLSSVFFIQNRYVIFDSSIISTFDDKNTQDIETRKDAFIDFIIRLTQNDTIEQLLEKIQYTDLFYFIKRVQENSVFVMV